MLNSATYVVSICSPIHSIPCHHIGASAYTPAVSMCCSVRQCGASRAWGAAAIRHPARAAALFDAGVRPESRLAAGGGTRRGPGRAEARGDASRRRRRARDKPPHAHKRIRSTGCGTSNAVRRMVGYRLCWRVSNIWHVCVRVGKVTITTPPHTMLHRAAPLH